ncbi:MAG TPA: hypothetical protein VNI20_01110 [Fimbriimonadaceae bacterium]|nr:hypothetical protein [Fimbriimonadaceae bacterium]
MKWSIVQATHLTDSVSKLMRETKRLYHTVNKPSTKSDTGREGAKKAFQARILRSHRIVPGSRKEPGTTIDLLA